ncbi:MAG: hypothetical protein KTR32_33405 [Granulosicoccus sp.]|nr:hypothetical protein [Granulosicoccus sp.]
MQPHVQQRQQRAAAARVLLSLHADGNLQSPERWTWRTVDRLPGWCLAGAEQRIQLQLTCGALYLSPDIRLWIDQHALRIVHDLLGQTLFDRIMAQADRMQLPRESAAQVIEQAGVEPATAEPEAIQSLLMRAGANVLSATVHESLPHDMLTQSLGPTVGEINEASALALVRAAEVLIDEADNPMSDSQTQDSQTPEEQTDDPSAPVEAQQP